MSTLKTTNLQHASAASPAIVLAADGSATAQVSSLNGGPLAGARNRIINGDMRIDQRNNGASVTPPTGAVSYNIDRWGYYNSTATNRFSIQRNAGSVTPPLGFTNYLGVTVTSNYTPSGLDEHLIFQHVEGFNMADLAWGTANAQTITVSFWVRSSLTGNHSGAIRNPTSYTQGYPFTFNIAQTNTWEYKTIAIPGPTSGTWGASNGVGLQVAFNLGTGPSYLGTAGAWNNAAAFNGVTGSVSVVATNGATFYITGVQLEAGTVATPFERRSYGQELALCQRYYSAGNYYCVLPAGSSGTLRRDRVPFPVPMRATSVTVNDGAGNTNKVYRNANNQSMTIFNYDPLAFAISVTTGGAATGDDLFFNWTCTGEL